VTVQSFSPAVYHCNVPFKSVSAVYESATNRRKPSKSQNPPIPAWPDIEDIDQWCCLPAFKRARFCCDFLNEDQQPDSPLFFQMKYVLDHRGEYSEEAVKEVWRLLYFFNFASDEVFYALSEKSTGKARRFIGDAITWAESHFYKEGAVDGFSSKHEFGHYKVGSERVYSAFLQNSQSEIVHGLLETISTTLQLAPADLRELWNDFFYANEKLVKLVQRFEFIEEIVANYLGMVSSSPEVREAIVDQLIQVQRHDGSLNFFLTFLQNGCRGNLERALPLMELYTILFDRFRLVPDEPLLRIIDLLDSIAGGDASPSLDDVDDWIIAKAPILQPVLDAVKASRLAPEWPQITLTRMGNEIELRIHETPTINYISPESILWEGFWESLRQQIKWSLSTPPFKVKRLICPYKRDAMPCCGRSNLIETLWVRIPKQWRAALKPPVCNS
jgi:hypothetical protein